MPSLYLGKIGGRKGVYEIHAFTKDLPFREKKCSDIGDRALFLKLLAERYKVLQDGRPIYCTAVTPDNIKKIEYNSHDERQGVFHVVALDSMKNIVCGLSIASDTQEKKNGDIVGLPLENRFIANGYPKGECLDEFRERYPMSDVSERKRLGADEMVELYRHFIRANCRGVIAPRLGVYTGVYHMLVVKPRQSKRRCSIIWVFNAIPEYYFKYKIVGAAALRNPLIENPPRFIAPSLKEIRKSNNNGSNEFYYKGECISRTALVPIPVKKDGRVDFKTMDIPFMGGVIDISKAEGIVREGILPFMLSRPEKFSVYEIVQLRISLSIIAKAQYETLTWRRNPSQWLNRIGAAITDTVVWKFI